MKYPMAGLMIDGHCRQALVEVEEEADEEEDGPKGPLALALSWLAMPLNLMFKYTMPDVLAAAACMP